MAGLRAKLIMRIAALGAATMGLSACYYDGGVGLGYYDDGYNYYDDGYGCDPYSPFDNYYDCDYRGGFYNIGYGGGWYQDYWYPGYGFYIFDRGGRRHNMYDHHRRYWAGQRYQWYRQHRGNRGGGHGWNHRDGDRRDGWREGDHRRRDGDGRRDRWRDGNHGANPGNAPNAADPNGSLWGQRSNRRNGEGRGDRRRNWQGNEAVTAPNAAPAVGQPNPAPNPGNWRRDRQPRPEGGNPRPRFDSSNRGNWQQQSAPQAARPMPPAAQPQPQPRAPRASRMDGQPSRPSRVENEREQ